MGISNNDEHSLWKATKYLKRPVKRNIPFKDKHGNWCRSDKNQANAFSEHLEEIFHPFDLADDRQTSKISRFLDCACQMDLPIRHTTPQEVMSEITCLNNNKSPGYDCINAKVAKSLPKKGILFLTLLFNSVFRLNHFPTQWKCAEIIMILKPCKPEACIKSYRPISLLVIFSKVFERILLRRLLPLLEKNNIVPEHQFGFRHKHGTPEQCHRITNIIRNTLEEKKYCSAVFLDVKQAFDRVWHVGLLYKIKKLLPAPYFLLFKSYLQQRSFYVKVRDQQSKICEIKAGIPQGSVLGPVLYTVYTSDMPVNDDVTVATYADDTAILASDDCATQASVLVQKQLTDVELWLKHWNILVNTEKSVHITFSLRRNDCPKVFINNNEIPERTSVKYLGLHLDRRLTWQTHIKAKIKQLNLKNRKMTWLIGSNSELSLENKILLYKALLMPIWTYGIEIWGTCSKSNVNIIQRYQSKTLRKIANAPWYITNKNIHLDLNIPFVKDKICDLSERYLKRLSNHSNLLAITLLDETNEVRRLKRPHILDLPFRKC